VLHHIMDQNVPER